MSSDINPDLRGPISLITEEWREYDWDGRVYRIDSPLEFFYRPGGETHRVVDYAGVVHCVPSPGIRGCVLRWMSKDADTPVDF